MKNSPTIAKTNVNAFSSILQSVPHDKGVDIFSAVLPDQFYTPAHESHERWTGERGLMLAVLQEAVQSYIKYSQTKTHRGKRLFAETEAWFWSQDHMYLFSFESICGHLQLDPDYIRRGLQSRTQSTQRHNKSVHPTYRRAVVTSHRMRLAQAA